MSLPPPSLDKTFGAAFCGLLVTSFLYGITSFQTYVYLRTFPKDGPRLKLLVWALWILDTVHTASASHCVYWYVITNYSNPSALDEGIWSLFLSLGLNVIIAFVVQCFFTKRVWALGRSKIFTTIVAIIVLAHVVFGLMTMSEMFIKHRLSRLSEITLFPVTPFGVAAVGSDIVIAAALCYYLHNVRTGVRSTEHLIDTLMIYAVERCLLTSLFAIVEIICFSALPGTLIYLAIDFFMGKLYANSLLATLNSRTSLRGRGNDDDVHSYHATRDARERGIKSKTNSRRVARPVSIEFTPAHQVDSVMFTPGSSHPDPLSFGTDSTPQTLSSPDKHEAIRTQVDHIV